MDATFPYAWQLESDGSQSLRFGDVLYAQLIPTGDTWLAVAELHQGEGSAIEQSFSAVDDAQRWAQQAFETVVARVAARQA